MSIPSGAETDKLTFHEKAGTIQGLNQVQIFNKIFNSIYFKTFSFRALLRTTILPIWYYYGSPENQLYDHSTLIYQWFVKGLDE